MFTGIITDIGTIRAADQRGDLRLVIGCAYDMEGVAIGASIACSGACLTVVEKGPDWFAVDLSAETVARTAPDLWKVGGRLNLERALKVGDELGGHIVPGLADVRPFLFGSGEGGISPRLVIAAPAALAPALAAKGSITVDGISLTVNMVEDQPDGSVHFGLNIIPHTATATTLDGLPPGRAFNLEIDVLARYLDRMQALRNGAA